MTNNQKPNDPIADLIAELLVRMDADHERRRSR
jgi:hypothetical protein